MEQGADQNYNCDYNFSYTNIGLADNYACLSSDSTNIIAYNPNVNANANNNANDDQISTNSTISANLGCRVKKMKGVRKRSWGRWVSEIRIPRSRERVWLGSYATAEEASRAYEAARHYLHNIRNSTLSKEAVQSIASAAAAAVSTETAAISGIPPSSPEISAEQAGIAPPPTPTLAYPIPPLSPSPAAISSMISFFQQRALRRRSPTNASGATSTSASSLLTYPLSPSMSTSSSDDDIIQFCQLLYN